nr:hypothetical protein [Streptomyces antibioticus]
MSLFGTRPRKCPSTLRVFVPTRVTHRFTEEILRHPQVEVGGKYVGFIRGTKRFRGLTDRHKAMGELVMVVLDYIDDGPLSERTAVTHRGDSRFQTQEFRKLEARFPELEHLGSWHSHHPNRLRSLSDGDIDGYRDTVNADGHNHDFFFASLGTDSGGFETARHFLFVRGDNNYYELGKENLVVDDGAGVGPAPPTAAVPQLAVPGWTDSVSGQEQLAHDRAVVGQYKGLRHVVGADRIAVTGQLTWDHSIRVHFNLLYPSSVGGTDGLLKVTVEGRLAVEVSLSGDQAGDLEFALKAADQIAGCAVAVNKQALRHDKARPRHASPGGRQP